MRRYCFILFIALSGVWSANAAGQSGVPDQKITAHMPGASRVHDTAQRELAMSVAEGALTLLREDRPEPNSLWVGLLGESPWLQELGRQGLHNLHNVPPDHDAYEVFPYDGVLYLAGNTPRGMLQAVYSLQEALRESGLPMSLRERGTFQFRERYFHQRFDAWPGEAADIRYISHLGASHCLLTHDWQGNRRHFQGYVSSPMYPDAVDAGEAKSNHDSLRKMIDACLDYGLEPSLWMTELPCQGGPWVPEAARQRFLERFPAEILSDSGTYQGKVLCFSDSKVQAFYRDLIGRFFADFPEISTIFLFGLDADGEFCDPTTCPRCAGMSKIEQRDRLIRFLIEEGQKVRPGLRVLTTGWGWSSDTETFLAHQAELPASSGLYLAAEVDGWQPERQSHDLLRTARALCREKGQTFIGYDDLHWGDDTVHSLNDIQDFPLGIAAKLRRWHGLGVDGIFDHWGGFNQDISSNSIACRAFFLNPLADPETVCRDIAVKQFGKAAGSFAFEAWRSLDRGHAALSNACTYPPSQWPEWYSGREYVPTPENFVERGLRGGEPPRQAEGMVYNPPELAERLQRIGDAWGTAFPHYQSALAYLDKAVAIAEETPIFYSFWWAGGKSTPTRREHLRRQRIYVQAMAYVGREIGLHIGLNALYERVGHDAAAYREQAREGLLEDAQACRKAADFLEALQASGDDRRPHQDWVQQYLAKAEGIEAYLK